MGYTSNSLQVETVTPDKASEFLNYNYAHQRKRNQAWVKYLANEMSEGRFMQTAEIHIMYCNGDPVLVNGQHTCAAIVEYGKPVRLTVRKTSTREPGQVAMMYAFGHDSGKKRTFTDGLGAYNIGEELGFGSHQVQRMAAALKFIRSGFGTDKRYANPSIVEVLDNMPDWAPFGRMFWNNTSAPAGELQRIRKGAEKLAVLSLVLVTYRYQHSYANDFWTGILSPGIMDTDPRWYARRIIEDSIVKVNRQLDAGRKPEYVSRRIAKCWGAYVNGNRMGQIPRLNDITPNAAIVIAGTPYTGRQPAPPWWPD